MERNNKNNNNKLTRLGKNDGCVREPSFQESSHSKALLPPSKVAINRLGHDPPTVNKRSDPR